MGPESWLENTIYRSAYIVGIWNKWTSIYEFNHTSNTTRKICFDKPIVIKHTNNNENKNVKRLYVRLASVQRTYNAIKVNIFFSCNDSLSSRYEQCIDIGIIPRRQAIQKRQIQSMYCKFIFILFSVRVGTF